MGRSRRTSARNLRFSADQGWRVDPPANGSSPPAELIIKVRAAANRWISDHFPEERRHISHAAPVHADGGWLVELLARTDERRVPLGRLRINDGDAVLTSGTTQDITQALRRLFDRYEAPSPRPADAIRGELYDFRFGDGIDGAKALPDRSIDLLLTDPPYGISNPYTCEQQVPRRLRRNGADFIMPKGNFGQWDSDFSPAEWTETVLPKVGGWAVVFCAQAQIGEYSEILKAHKFVAVGTLVWQKTNPVPFNHTHKPINAWEALVVGKRSGTKFNGHVVHNVFVCKSPSPQARIHPTQKPLDLISRFVELFSDEGDLVYDPFAGSATTVIGACRMSRRVLAYENDPAIYPAAVKRVLAETGQRFA